LPSSLVVTVVPVLGLPRGYSTPTSQTGIHHLNQQRVSRREQRDRQTRPANGGIPGWSCRIRKILLHFNIDFCLQAHNHNPASKEPLTVGTSSRQLVRHRKVHNSLYARSHWRYWFLSNMFTYGDMSWSLPTHYSFTCLICILIIWFGDLFPRPSNLKNVFEAAQSRLVAAYSLFVYLCNMYFYYLVGRFVSPPF
jgi:hypothetical protein